MNAYDKQLLAQIDQLAAEADQLQDGASRRTQLADQIAALNVAITKHSEN